MKTDTRPTLKRRKTPEDRRSDLIKAAIHVIGRKGLSNTTLADIAKTAATGYGNLTFYFKTKDALLLAAIGEVARRYDEIRDAAVASAPPSPAMRLDALIASGFGRQVANRKMIAVWYAFLSESDTKPAYKRLFLKLQDADYWRTRCLCDEIIAAGGYDGMDPHSIAICVNAMINGLWIDMKIKPEIMGPAEALGHCRRLLSSLFPREFAPLLDDAFGEPLDDRQTAAGEPDDGSE